MYLKFVEQHVQCNTEKNKCDNTCDEYDNIK